MSEFDPFAGEDENEEETETTEVKDSNKSFKELRTAYNRAEKERKQLAAEAEELRQFRAQVVAERTDAALTSAFTEVGLNPQHSKLFKALNPDVTPDQINAEAVAKFAAEYALVTTGGETVAPPEEKPAGFTPVVTGQGTSPNATLTTDDIRKLMAQGDFDAVEKAYKDGRVAKEQAPWATYS